MAIQPRDLYNALRTGGVRFFTGVPDSLLAGFCSYLGANCGIHEHVIAPNEGSAVGLAAGYHLTTGNTAAVYLQNSGLGNAINPLVSLTDPAVYSVPLLLIIGWRGEPGQPDEPQHRVQGGITLSQLDLLQIPHEIIDSESDIKAVVRRSLERLHARKAPVAMVVRAGAFGRYEGPTANRWPALSRESALRRLLRLSTERDLFIATTGKTSRELFELRVAREETQRDFLTVGSMGHASAIALGAALGNPMRRVLCLDGDGAMLMHMGMLPTIGVAHPSNLVHAVLNNAAHESVGGHPTVAGEMDIEALASASGYGVFRRSENENEIDEAWQYIETHTGPALWEVRVALGSRPDLGRPTTTPLENKTAFMEFAQEHR